MIRHVQAPGGETLCRQGATAFDLREGGCELVLVAGEDDDVGAFCR